MTYENLVLCKERDVHMTCILQDCECTYIPAKERPAIIIFPGGAYQFHSDRESEPVARAFLNAGFHAFILYYSVGENAAWPNPLDDYESAVETILAHAEEWHTCKDKIAVLGFSAGGHLAACAATMAKTKPAAALLGYPVIKRYIADICTPGLPLPCEHVGKDTSPCFLFASRDDRLVDVSNFLAFQQALSEHGIQFESHIYGLGGHGFSTGAPEFQEQKLCGRVAHWVPDSIAWLSDIWGEMIPSGFSQPIIDRLTLADASGRLSLDCSISFLKGQPAGKDLLNGIFSALDGMLGMWKFDSVSEKEFCAAYTARFIAVLAGIPQNDLDNIEKALNSIPSV